MIRIVYWTGIMSLAAGTSLQFPVLAADLMAGQQTGMLMHLFGFMAMFLGIMLILGSRDLPNRAPLVAWEGILRLFGSAVMAGYGVWGGGGITLVLAGLFDLIVGLIYLIGLPRHLGRPLVAILLDSATRRL